MLFSEDGLWDMMAKITNFKHLFFNLVCNLSIPSVNHDTASVYLSYKNNCTSVQKKITNFSEKYTQGVLFFVSFTFTSWYMYMHIK